MKKSLYSILGVSETATNDEIKQAYRDLSKKHHPDKGGTQEEASRINYAYDILSNPEKRFNYDENGDDEGLNETMRMAVHIFKEAMSSSPANVMDRARKFYEAAKRGAQNQLDLHKTNMATVEKQLSRIVAHPKKDFLREALEYELKMVSRQAGLVSDNIDKLDAAILLLESYEFTEEEDIFGFIG